MIRTPMFKFTADKITVNDNIMKRIIDWSLTDNKAKEADELTITLDDGDGLLELPKRGVKLQCFLGYTDTGMVDMGTYTVDSSEWSGPADKITVKAKSADFKSSLKQQRCQSYHQTTLGEIAQQVARRQELELVIKNGLEAISLSHIDQTDESDIHLLTRLCHAWGAVVTIKHGKLLIFIANSNETVTGRSLDLTEITRRTGDGYRFSIEDRQGDVGKVQASYHDKKKGKRQTVDSGGKGNVKKLKGTYKDKKSAQAAVQAELKRIKDQQAKFSISTAYAYPAVTTESPIKLIGFKPEIDNLKWTVDKATHSYSKSSGFVTALELVASLPK